LRSRVWQHDIGRDGDIDIAALSEPSGRAGDLCPPSILKLPAATITFPPGPEFSPFAEAAISVFGSPLPLSASVPGVITLTEPPAPVPVVVLAIAPPAVKVICGAVTVTDPALPLALGIAKATIPLPGSLNTSGPCAVTRTLPPLPTPAVLELTSAPPESASAPPAAKTTSPA
jgi:hypothetical protein